ncbi:MAG: aldo/keto reductase [Caldilineaceae bacterium]
MMEGLERSAPEQARSAIGVSNFSVENMEQVREVGEIHAHQLAYNLFWRFAEDEIIPYCQAHDIAVVTYSSIAQGVLTGKFGRDPQLPPATTAAVSSTSTPTSGPMSTPGWKRSSRSPPKLIVRWPTWRSAG